MMHRRSALQLLLSSALMPSCARPEGEPGVVRIGVMSNLTHAPMLLSLASGRLQRALPGIRIEVRSFRAGPRVTEALLGGAIDVGTTGPAAIIAMQARHKTAPLRVLSGCASGGASLVVRHEIRGPGGLHGRSLAVPQLGTTQDFSLRSWLDRNGLQSRERGGDVTIHALDGATTLDALHRGTLAGAWMPEPWATRLVHETPVYRMLDERDLWPARRFPTALLVARSVFAERRRAEAIAVSNALGAEIDALPATRAASITSVRSELARLTGKALARPLIEEAWPFVDFTSDSLRAEIGTIAADAKRFGYVESSDVSSLFVA